MAYTIQIVVPHCRLWLRYRLIHESFLTIRPARGCLSQFLCYIEFRDIACRPPHYFPREDWPFGFFRFLAHLIETHCSLRGFQCLPPLSLLLFSKHSSWTCWHSCRLETERLVNSSFSWWKVLALVGVKMFCKNKNSKTLRDIPRVTLGGVYLRRVGLEPASSVFSQVICLICGDCLDTSKPLR